MKSLLVCLLGLATAVCGKITISVSDVEPLPLNTAGEVFSADELFRQQQMPISTFVCTALGANVPTLQTNREAFEKISG